MGSSSESLKGKLLVASPALVAPVFWRTVILVTEHTDEAAMGLVLNRPTDVPVAEAVPPLAPLVDDDARLHVGGPVQPEAIVALAEFDDPDEAGAIVLDDVGFLPADADAALLAGATRRSRVFAGYSGWGPGQLESELSEPAWIVAEARPEDVFSPDADGLWSTVLRRKGGRFALLARMPADPSVN